MTAPANRLVLLQSCADSVEASAVRSLLQAHGIACTLQGENHRALLGTLGSFIEVNVLVPEGELGRARELLEGAAPEPHEGPALVKDPSERCPVHDAPAEGTCARCGSFVCTRCAGTEGATLLCDDCDERVRGEQHLRRKARRRMVAWVLLALFLGLPGMVAGLLGLLAR